MTSLSYIDFWHEWFGDQPYGRGGFPRNSGSRKRRFLEGPKDFVRWIQGNERTQTESYSSVQPFSGYETPVYLEKIFYDFDNEENPSKAGDDAFTFKERLMEFYDTVPLIDFSGSKGYHVWVFLESPFGFDLSVSQLKVVYNKIMHMLPGNAKYESLDASIVGDIKQLARVPYTHHQKTHRLCTFVDDERKPIVPPKGFTEELRRKGISRSLCESALKQALDEEKTREKKREKHKKRFLRSPRNRQYNDKVRPCIEAVLAAPDIHTSDHKMKIAAVAELNAKGWGADRIVSEFLKIPESSERKTRYFVNHAIKKGYMPFRSSTISEMGSCLGSSCSLYRRMEK